MAAEPGGPRGAGGVRPRDVLVASAFAAVFALAALAFCLAFGPTPADLLRAWNDPESLDRVKVFSVRLPRALAAFEVGAALAIAGLVFQALIRNPLASPYILGVSAGGSLGAVLALVIGLPLVGPWAFLGACGAILLVYAVASERGRVPATSLLLAGVI